MDVIYFRENFNIHSRLDLTLQLFVNMSLNCITQVTVLHYIAH